MQTNDPIICAVSGFYVINSVFTFRFQRTTLGISRVITGTDNTSMQAMMSPQWIGFLGGLHTVLMFCLPLPIWDLYGWRGIISFLAYTFVGLPLIHTISPFPSYRFCFLLVSRELDGQIKKGMASGSIPSEIYALKESVEQTKAKYRIG